ncbi:hypothetical protein HN018_06735 [Lichenicola cladoniae]|uniref:GcrA cell cycle regulator n=1 Tax=Lichenicola cladoniae TaxID=1484109 RepID=A0A6M8HMX9_9PROT|nr:hypothetical protein [Acetobacteraceae bacterium]QKE89773.1 hypothetical protein HN018_06735 [Lichenicola cladoniae]
MPSTAERWTPERDQVLRELWHANLSTQLIGQQMGVTKNSVIGRSHRLQLTSRPSPIRASWGGAPKGSITPQAGRVAFAPVAAPTLPVAPAVVPEPRPTIMPAALPSPEPKPARSPVVLPAQQVAAPASSRMASLLPAPRGPIAPPSSCQWPMHGSTGRSMIKCGAAPAPAKPYCLEHLERAHVRAPRSPGADQ